MRWYAGALVAPVVIAAMSCSAGDAQPTIIGDPLPGYIYLLASPRAAPRDLTIRLDWPGGPATVGHDFAKGADIVVDRPADADPGDHWIDVDGTDCAGRFPIVERVEIDLLLTLADDGCRVDILGSHPEGAAHHGDEAASLGLRVPIGSQVRLHRVDPDAAIPDRTVEADEAGSIGIDFIAPGRYEVVLVVRGADTRMVELDLAPGDDVFLDLAVP